MNHAARVSDRLIGLVGLLGGQRNSRQPAPTVIQPRVNRERADADLAWLSLTDAPGNDIAEDDLEWLAMLKAPVAAGGDEARLPDLM